MRQHEEEGEEIDELAFRSIYSVELDETTRKAEHQKQLYKDVLGRGAISMQNIQKSNMLFEKFSVESEKHEGDIAFYELTHTKSYKNGQYKSSNQIVTALTEGGYLSVHSLVGDLMF